MDYLSIVILIVAGTVVSYFIGSTTTYLVTWRVYKRPSLSNCLFKPWRND